MPSLLGQAYQLFITLLWAGKWKRWNDLLLHSPWPHKLPFPQCHHDLTFYSSEYLSLQVLLVLELLLRLLLALFIRTNHYQYLPLFEIFHHHPLQTGRILVEQKPGLRDAPCLVHRATVLPETNCPLSPLAALEKRHGCIGQSPKYQ